MALDDERNEKLEFCYGVSESQIMPMLLSSLTTTEICLMFLIQKCGTNIYYKSRNCKMEINGNGNCCQACQVLLNNLIHFHHLYLKQSCSQYSDSNKLNKWFNESFTIAAPFGFSKQPDSMLAEIKEYKEFKDDLKADVIETNLSDQKKLQDFEDGKTEVNIDNKPAADINVINLEERNGDKTMDEDTTLSFSEKLSCVHCGEICSSIDELNKHRKTCRKFRKTVNRKINTENNYSCEVCGEVFNNTKLYGKHLKRIHCKVCGEATMSLDSHMKKRHEKRNKEKCPFCDKLFLISHIRGESIKTHFLRFHYEQKENTEYIAIMNRKPISIELKCDLCEVEEVFKSQISLVEHKNMEHGRYSCEFCGIKFYEKSYLSNHILSKHKICEKYCCGQHFDEYSQYSLHRSQVHKKMGQCPECNKTLLVIKMNVHFKMAHSKVKDFICNICGLGFAEAFRLRRHIRTTHDGIRPFPCEVCSYRASSITNLNLHRYKMHNLDKICRDELIDLIKNGMHPYSVSDDLNLLKEKGAS